MDEAIATVVSVCGTTPDLAARYVQLADGDANQAVQLFFESGGADLFGSSSSQNPPPRTTPHQTGDAGAPIDVDAEDNISDDNDPEVTGFRRTTQPPPADYEDDEAIARRLQNEMYGEGDSMNEEIRAPIARQAETLVGGYGSNLPMADAQYSSAVEDRMRTIERRRQQGQYPRSI